MGSNEPQSDIALRPELDVSGAPLPEPAPAAEEAPVVAPGVEMPPSQADVPLENIPRLEGLRHPPEKHDAGSGAHYSGIRRPIKARTFEPTVGPAPLTELVVDAPTAAPAAPRGPEPESLMYPTKMRSFNHRVSPSQVVTNAPDVCPPPADADAAALEGLANPKSRSLEDRRAPAQLSDSDAVLTSADALKRASSEVPPSLSAETMRAIEETASTVQVAQSVDVMLNVRHSDGGCLGVTIDKPASDAAVIRTFVCPAVNGACPAKRDASCHYVNMPIGAEPTLAM